MKHGFVTVESRSLSSSCLQNGERKLHALSAWLPRHGLSAIFGAPGLTVRGVAGRSRPVRTDVRLSFPKRHALEFASNRVHFTSEKTFPARMKRFPLPLPIVRARPQGAVYGPNLRMELTL
jgi:hypothetical protein